MAVSYTHLVDGKVLKTGHNIYEEYLEMYPYTEATYQIREEKLTGDGLEISCPQIEGFRDERIQEKWNQIMLATEQTVMDQWEGNGTYRVTYTVKTMTPDTLSILMDGTVNTPDTPEEYTFKYTYNIDQMCIRDSCSTKKVSALRPPMRICWRRHIRRSPATMASCSGSVSYTHLDVYKRQVLQLCTDQECNT